MVKKQIDYIKNFENKIKKHIKEIKSNLHNIKTRDNVLFIHGYLFAMQTIINFIKNKEIITINDDLPQFEIKKLKNLIDEL